MELSSTLKAYGGVVNGSCIQIVGRQYRDCNDLIFVSAMNQIGRTGTRLNADLHLLAPLYDTDGI
jgi:hypothetical protein